MILYSKIHFSEKTKTIAKMSPSVHECYEKFVEIFPEANETLTKGITSCKNKNFGTKLKETNNLIVKLLEKFKPNAAKRKNTIKTFWTKPATSKLQTKNTRRRKLRK